MPSNTTLCTDRDTSLQHDGMFLSRVCDVCFCAARKPPHTWSPEQSKAVAVPRAFVASQQHSQGVQGELFSALPAHKGTGNQMLSRVISKLTKGLPAFLILSFLPEERHQSSKLKQHKTFLHTYCAGPPHSLHARSAAPAAASALNQLQQRSIHVLAINGEV